jgi:hypothetical protein
MSRGRIDHSAHQYCSILMLSNCCVIACSHRTIVNICFTFSLSQKNFYCLNITARPFSRNRNLYMISICIMVIYGSIFSLLHAVFSLCVWFNLCFGLRIRNTGKNQYANVVTCIRFMPWHLVTNFKEIWLHYELCTKSWQEFYTSGDQMDGNRGRNYWTEWSCLLWVVRQDCEIRTNYFRQKLVPSSAYKLSCW